MTKVKLAVVQYKPHYLNVGKNLKKFERVLKKILHFKPDLVIFPEYSLTGPLYGNYRLAFSESDKVFEELCVLAKKYRIDIVPGSFVLRLGAKKFNSTCYISSEGKILDFYSKQYLWSSENVFLKSGNKTSIIKTKLAKVGLQICADLHSSKISDDYRNLLPDIIINSAMWAIEDIRSSAKQVPFNIELLQTELLARARAVENRCYFILCNFAGKLKITNKSGRVYSETSIGNTLIVNPFGEVIAKTSSNREGVLLVEIDTAKCHWSRYNY